MLEETGGHLTIGFDFECGIMQAKIKKNFHEIVRTYTCLGSPITPKMMTQNFLEVSPPVPNEMVYCKVVLSGAEGNGVLQVYFQKT